MSLGSFPVMIHLMLNSTLFRISHLPISGVLMFSSRKPNVFTVYLMFTMQCILIPIFGVFDDVIRNFYVFNIISDNVIVIIGLKKMIVFIVFGNIQMIIINVIVNFCINGRFKSCNE